MSLYAHVETTVPAKSISVGAARYVATMSGRAGDSQSERVRYRAGGWTGAQRVGENKDRTGDADGQELAPRKGPHHYYSMSLCAQRNGAVGTG